MKSLLIDNWTVEKAIANTRENTYSPEIKRLICFMVLWDDVYYLENESANWWKERIENREDLRFLFKLKPLAVNTGVENEADLIYNQEFKNKKTAIIAKGAIEYIINATKHGIHYAPVDERASFIEKEKLRDDTFTRNEIVGSVEKEMLAYFRRSAEKINSANIHLGMDSLFSLIKRKNHYDISKDIEAYKKSPRLLLFKRWVDGFENNIIKGKDLQIDEYLNELHAIKNSNPLKDATDNVDISAMIKVTLPLSFIIKGAKLLSPRFLFPCYLYRKGIKHATEIVFPSRGRFTEKIE